MHLNPPENINYMNSLVWETVFGKLFDHFKNFISL